MLVFSRQRCWRSANRQLLTLPDVTLHLTVRARPHCLALGLQTRQNAANLLHMKSFLPTLLPLSLRVVTLQLGVSLVCLIGLQIRQNGASPMQLNYISLRRLCLVLLLRTP